MTTELKPNPADGKLLRPGEDPINVKIFYRDEEDDFGGDDPPNHEQTEIEYISPKA